MIGWRRSKLSNFHDNYHWFQNIKTRSLLIQNSKMTILAMRNNYYIFFIFILFYSNTCCQTININSITTSRQTGGDNGYTLDGTRMAVGSRLKLLNTSNFGSTGTYPKNISIFDSYGTIGSLTSISTVPVGNIFFFGSFNKLDASTQQFTGAEVDSLYNWSLRGGKLIIASGIIYSTFYDASMLNSKWGYGWTQLAPNGFNPTTIGNNTDIFNGPFGNIIAANQGAAAQGFFSAIPPNSKVFATDANGNPSLFMDCTTLDLIIADIDGYTDLGGITSGVTISNTQDKFLANTIVFMDKLQALPIITNSSNNLSLNSTYNNYQWYLNNAPLNNAVNPNYFVAEEGNYYVEVTLNGGCIVKSNVLTIDIVPLIIPNIFTPNNDGVNDVFKITTKNIAKFNCNIYNRWGILVNELTESNEVWDGRTKSGLECTVGVYYYVLTATSEKGKEYNEKGVVQLIR